MRISQLQSFSFTWKDHPNVKKVGYAFIYGILGACFGVFTLLDLYLSQGPGWIPRVLYLPSHILVPLVWVALGFGAICGAVFGVHQAEQESRYMPYSFES